VSKKSREFKVSKSKLRYATIGDGLVPVLAVEPPDQGGSKGSPCPLVAKTGNNEMGKQ